MITILHGDSRQTLKQIETESVHCCVTSPPYWGLRDYGHSDQIGQEPTPEEYVANLVAVFREVRRVLRSDGTCWLNLGDSYASGGNGSSNTPHCKQNSNRGYDDLKKSGTKKPTEGLKPKDLVGIPWMVAFALRADGWYLRQDIIWAKPNPMPESMTDRCTKSHEYIFLLTKSPRYFYDQTAIKEPIKDATLARLNQDVDNQDGSDRVPGKTNGKMKAVKFGGNKLCPDTRLQSGKEWNPSMAGGGTTYKKGHSGYFDADGNRIGGLTANKKSVWTVTTRGYKEAHFATYPPDLIKPCILAGTSARGCCTTCGAPWERVVELGEADLDHQQACGGDKKGEYHGQSQKEYAEANAQDASATKARILAGMRKKRTTDWQPTCCCDGVDRRLIATPTGEVTADDPSLTTGRSGMNRPRGENEGQRPITRYEQAQYAAQLKKSPYRPEMEQQAGPDFAHYIRTDESGARPVPEALLEKWISDGWITRVKVPPTSELKTKPCVVLDPFGGSGTTGMVSLELGRQAILCELNEEYIALINKRTTNLTPGLAL